MNARRELNKSRRKYYWLYTKDPDTGKPFLIAGGDTEEATRSKGLECLGGIDFRIIALPTRNLGRASQMIRGKRLEDTHSLSKANERLRHERSLHYLGKRRHL